MRSRRLLVRSIIAGFTLVLLGCGDGGSSSAPGSGEYGGYSQPVASPESSAPTGGAAPVQAEALYKQYCASCHGPDGKGNGPAAAALPVKPADHTNAAVMSKISDAELFKAIKEGGQAAGKSPAMAPWGGTLKDEQIRALVAYVRSLAKPR